MLCAGGRGKQKAIHSTWQNSGWQVERKHNKIDFYSVASNMAIRFRMLGISFLFSFLMLSTRHSVNQADQQHT